MVKIFFFDVIDTHKSYDRVVVAAVWLILAHSFGINSVSFTVDMLRKVY